jgi:hypothetical protein
MTLQSNRQYALDWVNAVRAEWGLEPLDELPKGLLGDTTGCTLGRATPGLLYNAAPVALDRRRRRRRIRTLEIPLPDEVQAFEADFERGFYPDLELTQLSEIARPPAGHHLPQPTHGGGLTGGEAGGTAMTMLLALASASIVIALLLFEAAL